MAVSIFNEWDSARTTKKLEDYIELLSLVDYYLYLHRINYEVYTMVTKTINEEMKEYGLRLEDR